MHRPLLRAHRAARRGAARGPRLAVLRQLRQRGRRGGAPAGPARHRPAEHRRLPRLASTAAPWAPRRMTTSGTKFRAGFCPLMGGVAVAPVPDGLPLRLGRGGRPPSFALRELDYLLATVRPRPQETAAFIVEPVLGEGGYVPANTAIPRRACASAPTGTASCWSLDEVQTGLGRTGRFWGHEHFGVRPGRPDHRQGPGQRVPAVGHRRAGGADEPRPGPARRAARTAATPSPAPRRSPPSTSSRRRASSRTRPRRGAQLLDGLRKVAGGTPGHRRRARPRPAWWAREFVTADGKPDAATAQRAQQAAARTRPAAAHLRPVRQRRADDPAAGRRPPSRSTRRWRSGPTSSHR